MLLLGECEPRLLRLTLLRLEIVVHIPPPQGIPLGGVIGFANDAAVVGILALNWLQIFMAVGKRRVGNPKGYPYKARQGVDCV